MPRTSARNSVGQNRDVWFFETCGGEDVDHLGGDDSSGDDLPDGKVQLLVRLPLAGRGLGEKRTHRLKEPHIVPNAQRLLVRYREREGLGQLGDGAEQPRLAVLLREDVLLRWTEQRKLRLPPTARPPAPIETMEQPQARERLAQAPASTTSRYCGSLRSAPGAPTAMFGPCSTA
jgi:hypothetical protein